MFSQSCNCLPNKKQSIFSNQSTQSMGLLRSFSNNSYHNSADHINLDFEATKKRNNNNSFGSRTNIGLMDLVYSFTDTSRVKFDRRYISAFSGPTERTKLNCKDLITHCNTMTTLPLARSYLVGGFVGSKSQLGRRRKNDVGRMNLWDIIRDLVDLVGNTPVNYPHKQNQHSSSFDKKCDIMQDSNKWKDSPSENSSVGLHCLEEPMSSLKQSYADVTKRPMKDHQSDKPRPSENKPSTCPKSCDTPLSVIEPISSCNKTDFSNRDRINSECSADSEDSFIVFECCEDDNVDKDSCSSDDETPSYFDEVSQSDSGIVPSSNSSFCCKQPSKKVRFADGKSLATVHPMVTWDYAYRMARRGPWEMLARDLERFKLRIAKTEAVLKPILDPQHRSVVYRDRFSDLER